MHCSPECSACSHAFPRARADISVRASLNPQRAQVGEPLTLAIEISGAQNVAAPAVDC